MSTDKKLIVSEIQRFCMHDGDGIRTTVFFKGCPLRCAWCHNPETQKASRELLFYADKCIFCGGCGECPQKAHGFSEKHEIERGRCVACGVCAEACPTGALEICGREYGIDELLEVIERDRAFYGERGGVTLSGGEPFMQGYGMIELLKICKKKGISTAIESCGYTEISIIEAAIPYTDLFLWDVKDTDSARHKKYTGVPNEKILNNLKVADSLGAKTRLRCILVNGVNSEEGHYTSVGELALSLEYCEGVEWLPYHAYGGTKSTFIGENDSGRVEWIPTPEQLERAKHVLRDMGVKVF